MARLLRMVILTGCVGLCTAASATANPGSQTFVQTYPFASQLCSEMQSGQLPKGLQAASVQLGQACTTLQNSFNQAQAAVVATDNQLTSQLQSDRAQAQSTCQQARKSHNRAACLQARQTFRSQAQALRAQLRAANKQYFVAVEAARKAFWSTVHSLRGGKHIAGDVPIKPQS